MYHRIAIILLLSLTIPDSNGQQSKGDMTISNSKYNNDPPRIKQPSNWKTILIIVVSVVFFAAVIYGSNCYHIIKMHFFERTEKKYTKMNNSYSDFDSCSHV